MKDDYCFDAQRINCLLAQISQKASKITKNDLIEIISQRNFYLAIVRDDTKRNHPIIAMASIYFIKTLTGLKGYIEDVVVDVNHRGRGLGRTLIKKLISFAKEKGVKHIDLTSSSKRLEAIKLYQSLGFKKIATNFYRLKI